MKKTLLSAFMLAVPLFGFSQLFQEDFDGNGPGIGAWTILDVDGQTVAEDVALLYPNAWSILTPDDLETLTSNVASSTSWYSPAGTANDWLISPQITISGTTPTLAWQSKAQDADFPDGYKLMLSTNGGNTVADFTVELFSTDAENTDWIERNVDLSAYDGQTIRFAFVNNSTDMFTLHVDNIKIVNNYIPPTAPSCPTLTLPMNNTSDVPYLDGVDFSWDEVADATNYDFYLNGELLGNTSFTAASIGGMEGLTTYTWRVVAINIGGESVGCTDFTFTTAPSPVHPYCGPLAYSIEFLGEIYNGDEPITLVDFTGINNATATEAYLGDSHEIFLDQTANVASGQSYDIKLEGNTGGDYENFFAVFIDWNQNGVLTDDGEVYAITQTITNSDGTDGQQAIHSITVPADALPGTTRMRVKKTDDSINVLDPCLGGYYGQAEDYSVNVATLAVSDVSKTSIKAYPNPVVEVLNIESPSKVKSVSIFDASGKNAANFELNATKSQVNLSRLAPGVYLVKVVTENGTNTIKVIKK